MFTDVRTDSHHGHSTRTGDRRTQNVPTQGSTPRGFGIDPTGGYLLAGNQRSDSVVVFRIDRKTGRLTPAGQTLEVGSPVSVKFVEREGR